MIAVRTFAAVRTRLMIALIFVGVTAAQAQEQERKLLDRLLKPDMSLQSTDQTKQFVASGEVMTKKAPTRWFFLKQRTTEKQFAGVKQYQPKEFATTRSRFAEQEADTSTRNKLTKVDQPYATTAYVTRDAHDNNKVSETSDYSGVRPFLVKGKSQKSLSAQDRPMTIDEVRELLNKNK